MARAVIGRALVTLERMVVLGLGERVSNPLLPPSPEDPVPCQRGMARVSEQGQGVGYSDNVPARKCKRNE